MVMKKVAKIVVITILLAMVATSQLAASTNDPTVIRISAFVPEKSTFTTFDNSFIVESNTYNFTYSVHQTIRTKMLFVMAN